MTVGIAQSGKPRLSSRPAQYLFAVHLVRSIKFVLLSFHFLQAQGSRMARTVFTDLACAAGFVVATLWLQPIVAEDSIDLSKSVRAQSPGVPPPLLNLLN